LKYRIIKGQGEIIEQGETEEVAVFQRGNQGGILKAKQNLKEEKGELKLTRVRKNALLRNQHGNTESGWRKKDTQRGALRGHGWGHKSPLLR